MGFLKGGYTAIRNTIPQLDAAVLATGDVAVGCGVIVDAAYGVCVLIQRVAGHKALESVDIIETESGMLRANQQEVTRRME